MVQFLLSKKNKSFIESPAFAKNVIGGWSRRCHAIHYFFTYKNWHQKIYLYYLDLLQDQCLLRLLGIVYL